MARTKSKNCFYLSDRHNEMLRSVREKHGVNASWQIEKALEGLWKRLYGIKGVSVGGRVVSRRHSKGSK